MNVQSIVDLTGWLLWASPVLPGAVHNVRAVREHSIMHSPAETGITCWTDKDYQGADGTLHVPYRNRWETLSAGQQTVNRSSERVEQAVVALKSWRILRRLRCLPTRITILVQVALFLRLARSNRRWKRSTGYRDHSPFPARPRGKPRKSLRNRRIAQRVNRLLGD